MSSKRFPCSRCARSFTTNEGRAAHFAEVHGGGGRALGRSRTLTPVEQMEWNQGRGATGRTGMALPARAPARAMGRTSEITADGDQYAAFVAAALAPLSGGPTPKDIPDRNSTGTASQKLRTRSTLSAPPGGSSPWDLHIVTSPLPNFSFFYSKRPSGGAWEAYRGVPRSTYKPRVYGDPPGSSNFQTAVARYRAAGQGYKLSYTGPTLADQGRVVAAQLPTHCGQLNTPPQGSAAGENLTPYWQSGVANGDPNAITTDLAPAMGPPSAALGYKVQGFSGTVGRWFDLPPGSEEAILQSTPTALQSTAKGVIKIRSDFDTGENKWRLSTEEYQLGLSRMTPDSAEVTADGNPMFWPLEDETTGTFIVTNTATPIELRASSAAPFDLKTSTILYTGMDSSASITVEEALYLVVDPQAQGPLAPNRTTPLGCSTAVLDLVSRQQQTTKAITHQLQDSPDTERGLIGNILGGLGSILAGILPGPWGAIAGGVGGVAQAVGNQLNLVPT